MAMTIQTCLGESALVIWGVLLGSLVIVVGGVVLALRRMRSLHDQARWEILCQRAWERTGPEGANDPLVTFRFHTYAGLLVFFTQTEHRPHLPAQVAIEYLRELHRYNLVNCLVLYPGTLYVPLLSWLNLRAQRRQIRKALETRQSQPPSPMLTQTVERL